MMTYKSGGCSTEEIINHKSPSKNLKTPANDPSSMLKSALALQLGSTAGAVLLLQMHTRAQM